MIFKISIYIFQLKSSDPTPNHEHIQSLWANLSLDDQQCTEGLICIGLQSLKRGWTNVAPSRDTLPHFLHISPQKKLGHV